MARGGKEQHLHPEFWVAFQMSKLPTAKYDLW